ncbi:hypothetical protein F5H01DRAFT_12720 [Linnemannia elongata]|nr:hypothetical protein F5H01DRAFT_12720 [Linnemannia elongata]
MIIQSKKAAKGRKNKAILKEKYLLAAKELVYDTFMLGVSQAPLNVIHRVEEEAVANLQSSSSCLADNTRDAYRIVFSDYKKFCDVNFSSETFRRYEVTPPKALAYLRHLFAKRTPKHIGPDTKARIIRLDRDNVISNQIPIEGASETVNLVSYSKSIIRCGCGGGCWKSDFPTRRPAHHIHSLLLQQNRTGLCCSKFPSKTATSAVN